MTAASEVVSRGSYDGIAAAEIAEALGLPAVVALESTPSTLDVAHALAAEGALPGTLVLADEQTAGRGRGGKRWTSARGQGIWLTFIERDLDPAVLGVLALRLGIAAAQALEPLAPAPVRVKWPNDLWIGEGKLAGILAEARWRDRLPEWVAIGMGVNVTLPADVAGAAGLRAGIGRGSALARLVPALRAAAARRGPLGESELSALAARDLARGRHVVEPVAGIAQGVSSDGALLVRSPEGNVVSCRAGSLVFAEES